jgi:hypothetical protein
MSFRLLFALLIAPAVMQAAYPDFSGTKPNGGQRGSDLKLTLQGARLADFEDLMFYSPGFKVKSVEARTSSAVDQVGHLTSPPVFRQPFSERCGEGAQ